MMPLWMQIFTDFFPATWAIDTIREIMIYEIEIGEVAVKIIGSIISTVTVYGLGIIAYKHLIRKLENMLKPK